ncbi:cytochrome P450 monooxygenase-like protein [Lepidopterella palustris CBS 459.81]|uniref:Cytochrome P450 monooxygenase-like protein n=1 Tax=Lepidopterella palustris CBS 459.81 TaxID=1314670 RepID=A0A8E2EEI2_9PEZI|nr:cytochrome P450 monooxygenase-like protein [Lepidopterella palustris CBS 459.81]
MAVPIIPVLALSAVMLGAVYKYIIHPLFFSPLRRIPAAHLSVPFSPLWILWIRQQGRQNRTILAAHERLGPVVRLGPREVSVNCVRGGLSTVYTGGMEKGEWYSNLFYNYGLPNMFSTNASKPHSTRKRMISNTYSKSNINSSAVLTAQTSIILYERFLPQLFKTFSAQLTETASVLNIYALISAVTMDIVTGYIFGLSASSNLTSNTASCSHFLDLYNGRRSYNFWPQELPGVTRWARKLGIRLVPEFVDAANDEIEAWALSMCDKAAIALEQSSEEKKAGENPISLADTPVVYGQLASALVKESQKEVQKDLNGDPNHPDVAGECQKSLRLTISSELLDHLAAGFDTSGITLTYLVHELSQRRELQSALRAELLTLSPPLLPSSAPVIPDAKALDVLPLLHAILWETLRLHPAIPGPQPRVTPAGGCSLGPDPGFWVPGAVRVSASAGCLHANESVFKKAGSWKPERWLEVDGESRKEMDRWFWAFGSGGRMCVGSNLAIYQMKYIVAAIYSNFATSIVDDSGIEQEDAYTAPPKSDKLMIQLERV